MVSVWKQALIPAILIVLFLFFFLAFKGKILVKEAFQTDGRIIIAYHIYCNKNTELILSDQLRTIHQCGLYSAVDEIWCCVAGEDSYIEKCLSLLKAAGAKYKVKAVRPGDTSYERLTLKMLRQEVRDTDKVLYIHTKGVTKAENLNVTYWRKWMEHFLVRKFKSILSSLNVYDTVGINYCGNYTRENGTRVPPHFSGNFWWATGKYLKTLPSTIGADYNDPETYIFQGKPKFLELDRGRFPECTQLYHTPVLPETYITE